MDKKDAEALAELLDGSGLFTDMFAKGGKRSHKAQYVRWLMGKVVEKRPDARVRGEDGRIHYTPPYFPVTTFKPNRVMPEATSERFGTVPRSEFINRMLEAQEGRATAIKRSAVARELKKAAPKAIGQIRVRRMKANFEKRKAAEAAAKPKITASNADEWIIKLSKQGLTTRAIVKKLKDEYGYETSQPTVTRRVKAFNDGKIDEKGKRI